MPSQTAEIQNLRRDLDLQNQPLRVVLVGFPGLDAVHDELEAKKELHELKSRAPTLIQEALKQALGEKWLEPRLTRADLEVRDVLARGLSERLGDGGAHDLATIAIGSKPPALQLEECLRGRSILGVYRQGLGAYLLRLRPGLQGLSASFVLADVAGSLLRESESPARIFLDRSIRGKGSKGCEGKGKGKDKGKKGKGKGGKGGRGGGASRNARSRTPGPREERPEAEAPPAAAAPAEGGIGS